MYAALKLLNKPYILYLFAAGTVMAVIRLKIIRNK